MTRISLLRQRSITVRMLLVLGALGLLALCGAGCKGDSPVAEPETQPQVVSLPDGTRLAIPTGAVYFYSHIPVTGPLTPGLIANPGGQNELVVARIDWSLCNPRAAAVEFTDTGVLMPQYTWRIPTLITTPLAGINILGIFSGGGTLEGGLRVDLNNGGLNDPGVDVWRVKDGCAGDWVSLYGYTR